MCSRYVFSNKHLLGIGFKNRVGIEQKIKNPAILV